MTNKRVKLYASIHHSEWKDVFLKEGIQAGDVEGVSGDKKVILVQHLPFAYGSWDGKDGCLCKVVEFEAPLDEVFVDWDDFDMEDLPEFDGFVWDKVGETWDHWNLGDLAGKTMYGAYVLAIKPEQIKAVYEGMWDETENWNMVKPKGCKKN